MSFSDLQVRRLRAKLDGRRVKVRQHEGRELAYVEGWYVMAEANRIFGFDGWDRLSHSHQMLYERREGEACQVAYLARVRVIVRAGPHNVVREGSGFGSATNVNAGEAHELALKSAETDATKRALATFGNRFGLSLYDKDQAGVSKARSAAPDGGAAFDGGVAPLPVQSAIEPPAASINGLSEPGEQSASDFDDVQEALIYLKTMRERLGRAASAEEIHETHNRAFERLRAIRDGHPDLRNRRGVHLVDVVNSIAELRKQEFERRSAPSSIDSPFGPLRLAIDKSRLAIATAKRHRNKDHLRRVAALPCLVCGRKPAHAHHIRFAQDRGMGLKVSDEFTVPLCAIDHDALHRSGDERAWWHDKQIDPLLHAERLWRQSRDGGVSQAPAPSEEGRPNERSDP